MEKEKELNLEEEKLEEVSGGLGTDFIKTSFLATDNKADAALGMGETIRGGLVGGGLVGADSTAD